MGGVVASRLSFDFKDKIYKSILIDPVLQPQSLKLQILSLIFRIILYFSNKFFQKNRASEMITNAKKRRSVFSDKQEILIIIREEVHLKLA